MKQARKMVLMAGFLLLLASGYLFCLDTLFEAKWSMHPNAPPIPFERWWFPLFTLAVLFLLFAWILSTLIRRVK